MSDENKKIPESLKLPSDLQIHKFKLVGSKLGKFGLGAEPLIVPNGTPFTTGSEINESIADEQPKDSTFGPVASDFVEKMGKLFDSEHTLRERPKPVPTASTNQYIRPEETTSTTISWTEERARQPKPTIDEEIKLAEDNRDFEKKCERVSDEYKHQTRKRDNFDSEFHIAAKYPLLPIEYGNIYFGSQEAYLEVFPKLTANRQMLYGYLQHLGMCVVDDTGRDPFIGDKMDSQKRGFLMLPTEIQHADYFAFEDIIREKFSFSVNELKLKLLEAQKENPNASIETINYQCTPEQMRELVDSLALDERFTHLFEKAEVIRNARKEKPRAEITDHSRSEEAEEAEPELPIFDPAQNKKTRWR